MVKEQMLASNLKTQTLQVALPRYFGQDFLERVENRGKFIEQNEKFQNFVNKLMDFDFEKRGNTKAYNRLVALGKKLFPEDPILTSGILRVPNERLAEEIALQSMASIEIIVEEKATSRSRYIEYKPLDDQSAIKFRIRDRILRPIIMEAIDRKNKTVTIKIHLDRQKDDIKRDLIYLLDLLRWEARILNEDLGKSKRPQWDVYDKYIKVFDLKKNNPKLTWGKIAEKIYPQHFKDPNTLKETDPDQNPESAIKLVKHYYKMAQKMINGGWRRI